MIATYIKRAFVLTLAGLLFSGYMSGVKLITKSCAFREACPYFLGYPACFYGFAMYFIMFAITVCALANSAARTAAMKTNTVVSGIGIIFAGSFVVQELMRWATFGSLGLSTCTYGLIFYLAIFALSAATWRRGAAGQTAQV